MPEFGGYLATHRKADFTTTLCQKFLGYALGRSLQLSDQPLLETDAGRAGRERLQAVRAVRPRGDQPAVPQPALQGLHTRPDSSRLPPEARNDRRTTSPAACCSRASASTVALPWLESRAARCARRPRRRRAASGSRACSSATASRRRTGGPKGNGAEMELGSSLEPLAPFKEKLNVINGPVQQGGRRRPRPLHRQHPLRGGAPARPHDQGRRQHGSAAGEALRGGDRRSRASCSGCEQPVSGFHESQYSMVYASHISWRNAGLAGADRTVPVAGVRQPLRRQGRQAPGQHPRRRAGPGERPARQGERVRQGRSSTSTSSSVRETEQRVQRLNKHGEGRRAGSRRRVSARRRASRRTSASTPGSCATSSRWRSRPTASRVATLLHVARPVRPGVPVPRHPRRPPQLLARQQGKEYQSIVKCHVEQYAYLLEKLVEDAGGRRHGAGQLVPHVRVGALERAQRQRRCRWSWPAGSAAR